MSNGGLIHLDSCQSDDRIHGPILHSQGCVLNLPPKQRDGVGHENFGVVEALLGYQLFVETSCLQRHMEQGWIAESQRPPRYEKWICGCVEVERVILERNLVKDYN